MKAWCTQSLLWVLIFLSSPVQATNVFLGDWYNEPVAFSFSLFQEKLSHRTVDGAHLANSALGVRAEFVESFFNSHLNLAMHSSRYWLRSGEEQREGNGYSVGLGASAVSPERFSMRVATNLRYTFDKASGEQAQYALTFHGLRGEVLAMRYFFDIIGIYLGAGVDSYDGIVTGNDRKEVAWTTSINPFYQIGIDILVEPGGHIGIDSRIRESLSVEVYFQRRY